MSLGARATKGGAKKEKQDKGKIADKPAPKEKIKPQATTEQLRMANMIDCKSEDPSDVRRMVTELMDMTRRTEEEVCSALHDTNNDMVAACNLLFEETQRIHGEWQTSEKRKKKPPAPTGNGDVEPPRDAPRSRSGPRTRRGDNDASASRGRGSARGRGGARGGRGAGRGARRGGTSRPHGPRNEEWPHTPDTGDYVTSGNIDSFPPTEDWDNEEWSGSLSDTKVFTPSVNAQNTISENETVPQVPVTEEWELGEANGPREPHIPTYTYHNTQQHIPQQMSNAANAVPVAKSEPEPYHQPHHQPMGMSGSLSAAQSQYLSQLTQQAQRHENSMSNTGVYTSNYGVYGTNDMSTQRKTQRVRVPPPSKIPSSAVEMPGGTDNSSNMFLDVQFGALEPEALHETPQPHPASPHPTQTGQSGPTGHVSGQPTASQSPTTPVQQVKQQVTSQPETTPVSSHETTTEAPSSYPNTNSMLNESLSVVDTTPTSQQPVTSEPAVTNSTSLDKLSGAMKQLGVSNVSNVTNVSSVSNVTGVDTVPPHQHHHYAHHRPKTVGQQNVYAPHHAVSHHPPVYTPNVYAPQVNSTNASLTGATLANAYPSSVTLTQYQPIMNSYQQQTAVSSTVSAVSAAYGGSALYTAPYSAAHPHHAYHHPPKHHKDAQYDNSVASSNSLTSTTTQSNQNQSTAKVTTTTAVSGAVNSGAVSSATGANTATGATGVGAGATGAAGYAGGALYGGAYAYDEQLIRSGLPHHMSGYYEVGYSTGREGTFGLGAGERFGRTDAASPQQVPAALPPGYAYFYQPPPTTYQYGVYPTAYGGGSSVGGVGGVGVGGVSGVTGGGKVSAYSQQQQPPYDAQDSYKPGGPYTANANKSAAAASTDLTNAMYPKTHVALNKVNSYEKAGFHSGTPPPFGAGSHLYIPAPPHHHPHHHAPQHQMDGRVNSSHNRRESGSAGRSGAAKPAASKPAYSQSYWAPN